MGVADRMPTIQALARELIGGKQPNQSVNPDEVVAIGAAIRWVFLSERWRMYSFWMSLPSYSASKYWAGDDRDNRENTTIPTHKSEIFITAEDNQTVIDIKVSQGERETARDNRLLGQFRL